MSNRVLSAGSITTEFQLLLFIDQIGKICSPAASFPVEILSMARRSKDSRQVGKPGSARRAGALAFQHFRCQLTNTQSVYGLLLSN